MRVHVIGAAGYAAGELVRLLATHPRAELVTVESLSEAGKTLGDVFPMLRGVERSFDAPGTVFERIVPGDAVVLGGTAEQACEVAPALLAAGARVVDLSDAFRGDAAAVYGYTPRYRDSIARAQLVANPGCYPTATLLAALPLAALGTIVQLVIDAKSGISGAGRTPAVRSLFAEVAGDVRAYGLRGHRHEAEIRRELDAGGIDAPFIFTPHVVPLARGMLVDLYAVFDRAPSESSLFGAFERAYAGDAAIRLLRGDRAPSIPAVLGTNGAEIHLSCNGNVARVLCAIDNLGRGAAAQAVTNLNIMYALAEETGVGNRALVA